MTRLRAEDGGRHAVERIRTLRLADYGSMIWVEIQTRDGATGVGEGCLGPMAIEAYLHEVAAPYLLGRDSRDIERHDLAMRGYVGYDGSGVETRGNGAINIGLWDLAGRATGRPLYELLGGKVRDSVRVYNAYQSHDDGPDDEHLQLIRPGPDASAGRPYAWVKDLVALGISATKVSPFDAAATLTGGTSIDENEIDKGLEPIRRIRNEVGDAVDILISFNGRWQPEPVRSILAALDAFRPLWYEDPISSTSPAALARLGSTTRTPVAVGASIAGRRRYKELLDAGALGILIFDVGRTGGISEARKIASLAETYEIPVAPTNGAGPLLLAASAHLSVHLPNVMLQEYRPRSLHGWHEDLAAGLPVVSAGYMTAPAGGGLGARLRTEVWDRPDAVVRTSSLHE